MTEPGGQAVELARARSLSASPASMAELRVQFAPNAPDETLRYFGQVCQHLELDPWLGHIVLIERYDAKVGAKVYRPQITVAGRRVIAFRTGRWRGMLGPEWCGPRRFDADGAKLPLEWSEVWDDDDTYPYAARCLVFCAGWDHPANGTVKWSEFAQYKDKDRTALMPTWQTLASHMLGKVAESLALRRGFPEVQTALAYAGDDDDHLAAAVAGVEVPEGLPAAPGAVRPAGPADRQPATASAGPAPTPKKSDRVPDWVYDNLPEAQGR